ncbi:MAG: HEAT repeat domain-containing protein [Myxococcaceae bacterium]|nr:HEAT repeat domain-containing protein [Myxococcaceae bacterium]
MLPSLGCTRTPKPMLLSLEVTAPEQEVLQELGLRTQEVRDRLSAALTRREAFAPLPSGAAQKKDLTGWRGVFEFDIAKSTEPPVKVFVRAVLALERPDEGRYDIDCATDRPMPSTDVEGRREDLRQALDVVLASCAEQAAEQVKVQGKSTADLVGQLDAGSAAAQSAALRVLIEKKRPESVPVLLERLKSDQPMVVRRAIGALVELKNPRAAGPLIDALKAKDAQFQREIVFALAAIGGDEAEAFLYTVAQGHEDPSLRAAAQAGLDEMGDPKRRRRDGGQ